MESADFPKKKYFLPMQHEIKQHQANLVASQCSAFVCLTLLALKESKSSAFAVETAHRQSFCQKQTSHRATESWNCYADRLALSEQLHAFLACTTSAVIVLSTVITCSRYKTWNRASFCSTQLFKS